MKSQLTNNSVIRTRDNTYYVVYNNVLLKEGTSFISLSDYYSDLTNKFDSDKDIVEVYSSECSRMIQYGILSGTNITPEVSSIWSRD